VTAARCGGIGVGDEPFAGVAALEGGVGEGGAAEEIAARVCLPEPGSPSRAATWRWGAAIFSLHEKFAPDGADADDLRAGNAGGDSRSTRVRRRPGVGLDEWCSAMVSGASPPWPWTEVPGQQMCYRRAGKNLRRGDEDISPALEGYFRDLWGFTGRARWREKKKQVLRFAQDDSQFC